MPIIRRLYGLVRPYRSTIALGGLCLLVSIAAELYPPLIWLKVVDEGIPNRDLTLIATQLGIFLAILAIGQVFGAWRSLLLEKAGQELTLDLRLTLYRKLQEQSARYYGGQRTGDLIARVTSDVEAIEGLLVRGTDSVLASGLRLLAVAGVFIALQPALGAIVVGPMVGVGIMLVRYNHAVRPLYRAARRKMGEFTARLSDNLGGMRLIQAFTQESRELASLSDLGRSLLSDQIGAVRLRNRHFPFIRFVANLGNFFMLAGGALFILRGDFTVGGLVAYRGYGRYFLGPVDELVGVDDLLQRASAAGQRIFEILDAPVTLRDAPDAIALLRPVRGEVRFEEVGFAYDPLQPALRDIDLAIAPGERVVILGPSGAGKSTLLSLVARAWDPDCGTIRLDGHDLRTVTLASLRGQIGQVQQDTFLFNASVAENVRFSRPEASTAEIEAACRAANAHDFIIGLARGYDTLVGERGVKLSGGQRQRISIARAILSNPSLLLLDEPTSAVEPDSEAAILDALERLMRGRTTLIATHRLSLAREADRVVIVEDGAIVEQGRPEELLARPGGRFARMMEGA